MVLGGPPLTQGIACRCGLVHTMVEVSRKASDLLLIGVAL